MEASRPNLITSDQPTSTMVLCTNPSPFVESSSLCCGLFCQATLVSSFVFKINSNLCCNGTTLPSNISRFLHFHRFHIVIAIHSGHSPSSELLLRTLKHRSIQSLSDREKKCGMELIGQVCSQTS